MTEIPVACGVLRRGDEVLIAQRPVGKIAAGKWEFPGGKIEKGEDPGAALRRELREELGIEVAAARPLIRIRHDYSDRRVCLDTWLVTAWRGRIHGHDNQTLAWVRISALRDYDLLAADGPIVAALNLPHHYAFTPPEATVDEIEGGLHRLPAGALLRLRLPQLDEGCYRAVAEALLPGTRARGLHLILDRAPALAREVGAAGWHASAARLRSLQSRPPGRVLASCHDDADLARARALNIDAVVIGTVLKSASHTGIPALGWRGFARLAAAANLPSYAIGGLALTDLETAQQNYGQGIAGISAYWPPFSAEAR